MRVAAKEQCDCGNRNFQESVKMKNGRVYVETSVISSIDFLPTWICTHIDNAVIKPKLRSSCQQEGDVCLEICTPDELMEGF